MNTRLSFKLKIILAILFVAGVLAATAGTALAVGCTPDGQPYVEVHDWLPNETLEVYANGQKVGEFTTDSNGYGRFAFGQPGVSYELLLKRPNGQEIPAGTIKCDLPELTRIDVTPPEVTLNVNEQQQFHAKCYDAQGNEIPITPGWSAAGGTITTGGLYTATTAGDFTVTASVQGSTVTGTATVHVNPPELTRIDVTPPEVTLNVNEQQQLQAKGYDAHGNEVPIDPNWSALEGNITRGSGGLYTATKEGDFTVRASVPWSSIIGIARVHIGQDDDGDGIRDTVEYSAPNNGDGNGDGVPDRQQKHVTSVPSATGQGYITVETTCSENQDVWAYTDAEACLGADFDYDYDYAYGLVGFCLPCSSATVRIYFHGIDELSGYIYRKYGPIPPDFDKPQWYTLANVIYGTTMIGGQVVAYVEFILVDGELGDDTGVDGQIIEPGGPAFIAGDFNMDLVVDFADLRFLAEQWLSGPGSEADLDGSGQVDNVDFALFSRNWRRQP